MKNMLITTLVQSVIIHSVLSRNIITGITDNINTVPGQEQSLSGDNHNRRILLESLKILANSLKNSDDDDAVTTPGYGDISLKYYSPNSGTGTITTLIPQQEEYWVPSKDNWLPSIPHRVPSNNYLVPPTDYWVPTTSPGYDEYPPVDYMVYGNSWGIVQQPHQGTSQQHPDSSYEEEYDTGDGSEHKTSLYEVHGIPDPDREYQEVTEYNYPQEGTEYNFPQDIVPYIDTYPVQYDNYLDHTPYIYYTPHEYSEPVPYQLDPDHYQLDPVRRRRDTLLEATALSLGVRINYHIMYFLLTYFISLSSVVLDCCYPHIKLSRPIVARKEAHRRRNDHCQYYTLSIYSIVLLS